ncbi:hypothetical protein YC2023_063561 [Brassica napus]
MGVVNALPSLVMAVNTPSRPTTKMMIKRDPELAAACFLRLMTLWRCLTLCSV